MNLNVLILHFLICFVRRVQTPLCNIKRSFVPGQVGQVSLRVVCHPEEDSGVRKENNKLQPWDLLYHISTNAR